MSSSKEYLDYILEQLSDLDEISCRAMMGEYIIYYRGKIVGGIYDDRFLVKPTRSAEAMMPDADREVPYEGAKEMLLVDDVEDRAFLRDLLEAMVGELPAPKKKKEVKPNIDDAGIPGGKYVTIDTAVSEERQRQQRLK